MGEMGFCEIRWWKQNLGVDENVTSGNRGNMKLPIWCGCSSLRVNICSAFLCFCAVEWLQLLSWFECSDWWCVGVDVLLLIVCAGVDILLLVVCWCGCTVVGSVSVAVLMLVVFVGVDVLMLIVCWCPLYWFW